MTQETCNQGPFLFLVGFRPRLQPWHSDPPSGRQDISILARITIVLFARVHPKKMIIIRRYDVR